MDYSQLKVGQQLTSRTFVLEREAVAAYISAVEDASPLYADGRLAPPTTVAALGLKGILEDLEVPGGTVHLGQELEFLEAVEIGESLTCNATIAQNSVRGQWRFLSVAVEVNAGDARPVLKGRSTIILPL